MGTTLFFLAVLLALALVLVLRQLVRAFNPYNRIRTRGLKWVAAVLMLALAGVSFGAAETGHFLFKSGLLGWIGGLYVGPAAVQNNTDNKLTGIRGANVNLRYLALPDAGACNSSSPDQHFNDLDGGTVTNCAYCEPDAGLGVYVPGVKPGDHCRADLATAGFQNDNIWHRAVVKENDVVTVYRCGTGWPIPLTALGDAGTLVQCYSNQ